MPDSRPVLSRHFFRDNNDAAQCGAAAKTNPEPLDFPLCCPLIEKNRCLIHRHPDRPCICRDYQCQLLRRYMCNEMGLDFAAATIRGISRLLACVKKWLPADASTPAYYKLLALWQERSHEESGSIITMPEQMMDTASLIRLVNRYILPFQGGFLHSAG